MNASFRPFLLVLPLLFACVVDDDESNNPNNDTAQTSDSDSGSGSGSGASMCEPNAGDGSSQCGGNICPGGEYCENAAAGTCAAGCESTLNCATGQWCDLRMPDAWGVGLCRPTSDPACGGAPDPEPGTCLDVQGNYQLSLLSGAPEACVVVLDGTIQCSVAQDGCTLSWGCGELSVSPFPPGTLDENDDVQVEGMIEGVPYVCDFDFTYDPMTWSCALTSSEGALVCEGIGS